MEGKERFEFGQRTLFDSGEEVTTFDGFNLDDFMQIICSLLNKQSNRIKDLELLLNADKKIETNSLNGFEKLRQENQQLKQQLHDLPNKIVGEIRDCLLDFSNGWWRYFMTDGCEYMLSIDLQGCLDEIIDTILKKYGWEDE